MKFSLRYTIYFLLITNFIWGYIVTLTPWLIWSIGYTEKQYWDWIIQGTPLEILIAYPLAKLILRFDKTFKKWCGLK